jgi:menaquinone-9 beta-reductase
MVEVLIAGAGPAGSVAAAVLAGAGLRVLLVDRARFPRDKLCGDSLNPGTLALLAQLGLRERLDHEGLRLEGMLVTGATGVQVRGDYPAGVHGRTISRRILDQILLERAAASGAQIELGARVAAPLFDDRARTLIVRGAAVEARGRRIRIPAAITIAADGRRSTLAFSTGLARHPNRPRRWAVGAYFTGVTGLEVCGEMHIRPGHYLGVAPLPDGLTNVCYVSADRRGFDRPAELLEEAVRRDPLLADRFARACRVTAPMSLGPLAVDVTAAGMPGLLLAGDAAGFIDPMTGDGMRFAVQGAMLAADAARRFFDEPHLRPHVRLQHERRRHFHSKMRFNRGLRALVGSAAGLRAGTLAASLTPSLLRRIVGLAGDVALARQLSAGQPAGAEHAIERTAG